MALMMHRLLEKELGKAGPNLSAERITESLSEARLQELVLGEKETYYAKSDTEGDFEAVAKAVGLGVLPRLATPPQLRSALKLNIGPTKKTAAKTCADWVCSDLCCQSQEKGKLMLELADFIRGQRAKKP